MSLTYLDDLTACLDCSAELAGYGVARGLCGRCYRRRYKSGTLEQRPLRPTRADVQDVDVEAVPALDLTWRQYALCAEVDADLWFPEKGGSSKEAKSVCAACLVAAECLDYALVTFQRFGIWGGVSERGRRRLLGLPDDDAEEVSAA